MLTALDTQLTLAALDEEMDFSPLDTLLDATALAYCTTLAFNDDTVIGGQRVLQYNVTTNVYTGNYDRDEDGSYGDWRSTTEQLNVAVHPEMTVGQIASALIEMIRWIPDNKYA